MQQNDQKLRLYNMGNIVSLMRKYMKNIVLAVLLLLQIAYCKGQNASFSYSQPSKCAPSTVTFTNTSSVGYTAVNWNWGDPTDPNPDYQGMDNPTSHPFKYPGKYIITLTLTYPSGTVTYKDSIVVYASPDFSFRKLNDSICPNGSVSFSSSLIYPAASSGVKSYYWNFGDGSNDTVPNPTHVYANSGNIITRYNLSLTITDTNGCVKQVDSTSYVYVKNKPIVNFVVDEILCFISGATSATVNFTYNYTSGAVRYLWDFGDGTTSTQATPSHTYNYSPNPYTVKLIATNAEGCSDTMVKTIRPLAYTANYTLSDTTLCDIPHTKVTVIGTDFGSTYLWYWGDGTSNFSSLSPVEHAYANQGNYPLIVEAMHPSGCRAYDTVIIHAHSRLNPVHDGRYFMRNRIDVDWTRCDTTIPFTFINTTSYALNNDFGLGSVTWIFEDGVIVGGDTISRKFSTYGEHPFTAIITTPYGCVLDTIWRDSIFASEPWILQISRLEIDSNSQISVDYGGCGYYDYLLGKFICKDILLETNPEHLLLTDSIRIFRTRGYGMAFGAGCIPVTGEIINYTCDMINDTCVPFIRSAVPIVKALIYWDFYGDPADTTDFALPSPPQSIIWFANEEHIYPDTGIFRIAMVVTNEDGCVDTIFYGDAMAGIPLTGTFTYEFRQQCRSEYYDPDHWFYVKFITDGDTTLLPELFYIVDPFGDTSSTGDNPMIISPKDTGYWGVEIIPKWHGCDGIGNNRIDSILYACPPVARFDFENIDPINPYSYILGTEIARFCNCPATIGFRDSSITHQWQQWWFGDAPLLSEQSTDTAKVTNFTYFCTDSFIYSAGATGIVVTLVAYNADSVDIYSPTYNRCKFCADTTRRAFYISDAKMNFLADKYEICTGDSITFYDSSIVSTKKFLSWNFWVDSVANTDPAFLDYDFQWKLFLKLQDEEFAPFYDYPLKPMPTTGNFGDTTLTFTKPNVYRFVLENVDILGCARYDTLDDITVHPQSVPQYVSSIDNRNFNFLRDTLCFNKPDTLYLRDSSYTAFPFEHIKVTGWQWVVFGDTLRTQNPKAAAKTRGFLPIELTITNEIGCKTSLIIDSTIVREAYAQWQTPRKRYCNGTTVTFTNRAGVYPLLDNFGVGMTCIWDWGDGTPLDIQNITSGNVSYPTINHRYNLPRGASDTVVVTLTAKINGMSCEDVFKDTLYIGSLQADFTADGRYFPCPSKEGRTINFSDSSHGNVTYYIWNFGDTLSGSSNDVEGPKEQNVIHKYAKSGTYNVRLIVEDNIGCTDTIVKDSYIFIDGPWGDFSYTPLSGCLPLHVDFFPEVENTDTIIVNPNKSIDLPPQGGTYVDSTVSYTYEQIGVFLPYFYIIKWTTDSDGNPERCVWEWEGTDTIFVIDIQPDFTADSLYCIGVPVSFQDESTILPNGQQLDSIYWDLGNGDIATTPSATTQYDSAGVYNASMTIYAKNCSKSISYPINVMPFPELVFHPDSAASCSNLEVTFFTDSLTDLENSRITAYNWAFSDGENYTGNPIRRTFTQTGKYLYDVLLAFTPENCARRYNDSIYVSVYVVPIAEFDPTPPKVRMGETIHFIDKSQQGDGNIISWQWSLGEDVYSQEQSPKHAYTTLSGYVSVYLVIEDANGCMDSIEHQVLILENLRFPNIFTPQSLRSDGRPYVFRPLKNEGYFKEFKIEVYNKWGMLIWRQSCTAPNCPNYDNDKFWWNGKSQMGAYVSDGVYYWVVYAIPLSETQTFILNGSVTVISEGK